MITGVNKMRKAAAQLQTSFTGTGHSELNMAILEEKIVGESMEKLMSVKGDAQKSWIKYAEVEQNPAIRGLFLKMAQMDEMYLKIHRDYTKEYESYRRIFKHVIQGEKKIDDVSKHAEQQAAKVAKMQKQVDEQRAKSTGKKTSEKQDKKLESMEADFSKAVSVSQRVTYDYQMQRQNQELFKYTKVREAWKVLLMAQKDFYERSMMLNSAQSNIVDLYTLTPLNKLGPAVIGQAEGESTALINSVADRLGMPAPEPVHLVRGEPAKPNRTTVPGEPGGHESNMPSYVATPQIRTDSRDSASSTSSTISRESSGKGGHRPLPPLPPDDENENAASTDDANQPNLYLDVVSATADRQISEEESYMNMQPGSPALEQNVYDNTHVPSPESETSEGLYYFLDGGKAIPKHCDSMEEPSKTDPKRQQSREDVYEMDGS